MNATKKSDLESFVCDSRSVCRIQDGSTNAYLANDRAIEDFLLSVEPRYDAAIAKLRSGIVDVAAIHSIAGFAAYVACCSPTAMRMSAQPLKAAIESTAALLDKHGVLPKAPDELGSKPLTELLADGSVSVNVDQKFPQALGIASIEERASVWGNSRWEILRNCHDDCPFFTSDYPIAIEAGGKYGELNRIIPLAPDLAIRIIPDVSLSRKPPDLSFRKFSCRWLQMSRSEVVRINGLIVRCAENIVFYNHNNVWTKLFIEKNRHFMIETVIERIPSENGQFIIARQKIVKHFYD